MKPTTFQFRPVACAITSLFLATLPPLTLANPAGEQVVSGQATFARSGSQLTVTNTPGAQINWQSFSINRGETTHFQQQSAASTVFNRVVGPDASRILGTLSSNGRVLLTNPNGILFGAGATVNVQSLIASTLDFRVGNDGSFSFFKNPAQAGQGTLAGSVINQGTITSAMGGQVWLVGENVRNEGLISAQNGKVLLAAGSKVTIGDTAAPELTVTLEAAEGQQAINIGRIEAQGGSIDMFGALLEQQGGLNVDSASVDSAGRIRLSSTQATHVSGEISARNTAGVGGQVKVLSDGQVTLAGGAKIDASGQTGGGEVLVGGDWQGKNSAVKNAAATTMQAGAEIYANALDNGRGGKVVLWSNGTTDFRGRIYALGGLNGGDGGQVETSGKEHLLKGGLAYVGAYKGKGGLWLIDPASLCFQNTGATSCTGSAGDIWTNADMLAALGSTYTGSNTAPVTTNGRLVFSATDTIDIYALDLSGTGFANQKIDFEVTGASGVINVRGLIQAPTWTTTTTTSMIGGVSVTGATANSPGAGQTTYTGTATVQEVETYTGALDIALKGNAVNIGSTGGSIDKAFVHVGANLLDGTAVTAAATTPPTSITNSPTTTTKIFNNTYSYVDTTGSAPPDSSTVWSKTGGTENTAARQTQTSYEQTTYTVASTTDKAAAACAADSTSAACKEASDALNTLMTAIMANDPTLKAAATAACAAGDTAACAFVTQVYGSNSLLTVSSTAENLRSFASVQANAGRDQLQGAQQERHEAKTAILGNSLAILERQPDAANIPGCGAGGDACIPDPRATYAAAAARAAQGTSADTPKLSFLPQIQRKRALMIAIDDYQNKEIPALEAPIRDAEAVGASLSSRLGYEVQVLKNPTKAQIISAMKALAETSNINDSVAVYYAGHGYQKEDRSQGYWLPADAGVDNPGKWIANSDIARLLEAIPSRQVMLVTDSCYSGGLTEGQGRTPSLGNKVDVNSVLSKRTVTVMASGGEEPVSDEGRNGHSIFAWSLLESLKKVDTVAPVSEQFAQIKKTVTDSYPQTPQYTTLTAADSAVDTDYLLERRQLR